MPYSSQPNREFARAPSWIFDWRQPLRVCVRADGTDPYGKSEPLQSARGGPHRQRVPAAQRSRRREVLLRRGRRRHSRRGRRGLPARPGVPGMRRPRRPEGRVHRRRRPEADPPPLRQEVHLPHRHRPRALPQAAPLWVSFIRLMRHNVPVECTAELCGVSHRTDFEWRRRVLATVTGYQDRIVLRETVWVDKIHINETDLSKGYGQLHKRSLSRQKLRI